MRTTRPPESERRIPVGDTNLYVVQRGSGAPLFILHGGPGLDHHSFGDYLDPLADDFQLIFVDQRGQGLSDRVPPETLSLADMAGDIPRLADSLGLDRYAVLGHSFGALVALQNAVDFPGEATATVVSSGFPSSKYLSHVDENLNHFEPIELREKVKLSWAREETVETPEDVEDLLKDQIPFHFANPRDPRIEAFMERTAGVVYSPDVLRTFAQAEYGMIEVEDSLSSISQPMLVLVGRYDRICSVEAAEAIASGAHTAELKIFENSGHMTFVEENEKYIEAVREFLWELFLT